MNQVKKYLASIQDELDHPLTLEAVDQAKYDLVFYPGGHGPIKDLAYDKISGQLLADRLAVNRPLALLCHGPAGLNATTDEISKTPFAGRKVTGLSNQEERTNSFARKAPWLLEDRLKELGLEYEKALLPFAQHVVRDGSLYIGQNPASAKKLAVQLVADFGAS